MRGTIVPVLVIRPADDHRDAAAEVITEGAGERSVTSWCRTPLTCRRPPRRWP